MMLATHYRNDVGVVLMGVFGIVWVGLLGAILVCWFDIVAEYASESRLHFWTQIVYVIIIINDTNQNEYVML